MSVKNKKANKTLMYFSGCEAIEEFFPEIQDNPNTGVLFTFFDIPKRRLKNIKTKFRREANKKKRGLK